MLPGLVSSSVEISGDGSDTLGNNRGESSNSCGAVPRLLKQIAEHRLRTQISAIDRELHKHVHACALYRRALG